MPQMPDAVIGPNIEIDIDQKHLVEVVDIEESASQYRDKRKDAMLITWKFQIWNLATGEAIIDDNTGLLWELYGFSPDTTFRNAESGKVAKAREWTEALIGREISSDEMKQLILTGFKEGLMGKKAVADLEWYTDKNGVQKVGIIRLRPYKPAPVVTPQREPVVAGGATESKEERSARLRRELEEAERE